MTISFPGSDVLFSSAPSTAPAGYATLGLANYGSGSGSNATSSTVPAASSAVNPYQQAYDNIETAVNAYLQNSIVNGPPAVLPEYTGGSSASAFASLNTLLGQLKSGLAQGVFAGTGFNTLA
ncbi:MAG TPA: hypothetical protein VFN49_07140 [Candidatus Aquilonibacter sp.]|nr:hypothetical protein [Candidatus Aquilonibacter sp.]